MKLVCQKLAAFAIAATILIVSALSAPVNITFTTQRIYVSPGTGGSKDIYFYDGVGLYAGNGYSYINSYDDGGGQVFVDLSFSTDLPPGRYSFSIQGDDSNLYWTGLVTVASGSGYDGSFGCEAFGGTEAPTDPPEVIHHNLLVEGSIEMQGRVFNMGINAANPDEPAFSLRIDGNFLRSISAFQNTYWAWETPNGTAMRLDSSYGSGTLYINNAQVLTAANSGSFCLPLQPSRLAVGSNVFATGTNSIAVGNDVQTSGFYNAAFGQGTRAQNTAQFVVGKYNDPTTTANSLFVVGNGTGTSNKSNAFVVRNTGDADLKGKLAVGLGGLDVSFGGVPSLVVGADENLATRTNNVNKIMAMAMPHYSNSTQLPMSLLAGNSGNGWNSVLIGGGFNGMDAATDITFFTAPNATTPLGLPRMSINHNGAVGIGAHAFGGTFHESFGGLDVSYGGIAGTLVLGAEMNLTTRTNQTPKTATIVVPHYSSSERPLLALAANTYSWGNEIALGNGSGTWNCATDISFFTGETPTSNFGKPRLVINRTGGVAAGEGAVANQPSQFVTGTFNKDSANALFAVGNGTVAVRDNALEVRRDGSVHAKVLRIPEAGDLSMGGFRSGPEPFAP
jgi:hypothetical protein